MTLALLVAIIATLGVVQRQPSLWPLVTWPVYAHAHPDVPASTTSTFEVRARTRDGKSHVLRAADLVEPSRHQIADNALERSVSRPQDRTYLLRLVDIAMGEDVERAELWEVTWRVEPFEIPPLQIDRPLSEQRVAVLRADAEDAAP